MLRTTQWGGVTCAASLAPSQRGCDDFAGGHGVSTQPTSASVLVVDDTIENLHLLASMLASHGYEVRPATSGRQALQAALSAPPEVILLDVGMPEMDGHEVCRRLKQHAALKDIPVVFLTALSDMSDKLKAFEAGGADYITKPFQVDEVLARVNVHVALRQSHLRLAQSHQRLQSLERLREDLVQMLVHDMRSPLAALTMLLESVRAEVAAALGHKLADELTLAAQAASRVTRIANDVLDVSRMEEGKLPLDRRSHDVAQICRDVATRVAALESSHAIEVERVDPLPVLCDRSLVERVVENLVGNAIKHSFDGAHVKVSAQDHGSRARVCVRDDGPGVPAEARVRIFEKFGTLHARREGAFHSTGLGLAFCKLAVEAHGGVIGVDPATPRGSVFWFELPVA